MKRFFFLFLLLHIHFFCDLSGQTILYPGDIAVLGLASNVGGEMGDCTSGGQFQGRDRISFMAFKEIETGTVIDFTDNGWERLNPGQWGNTEGFIRAVRTGLNIQPGQIITFEFPPTQTGHLAVAPDGEWEFQLLGTNALNFNDSGDQLYIMQGGEWNNGTTIGCCNGEHDATYTAGRILFGFNSGSEWNAGINDSQNSGLHPDVMPCFSMAPTNGVTSFTSYTGPLNATTQLEWIGRIANPANWSAYNDCESYQDPPGMIPIALSGMSLNCQICFSCTPFTDTLLFMLPEAGSPFVVEYTDGTDTIILNGAESLSEVGVFISEISSFELIKVTDVNGCPVYSNFETGTQMEVSSLPLTVSCRVIGVENAEVNIGSGQAPFTLTWTDDRGNSDMLIVDQRGAVLLEGLEVGRTYQIEVVDAGGCDGGCSLVLEEGDCSTVELQAIVQVSPAPDCNLNTINLEIISVNGGAAPYSLLHPISGELNPIIEFPFRIEGVAAGTTTITLQDNNGCTQEQELPVIAVEPGPTPSLDLGSDVSITLGQSAVLNAQASFLPVTVMWQPMNGLSDPRSLVTAASPTETTQYIVTAFHEYGCSVSDTILVEVSEISTAFIPTAFSPNNDGVNDRLTIFTGPNITEIRSFKVFDRWGALVFEAPPGAGPNLKAWDGNAPNGQPAVAGVYLYFAELVDLNGRTEFLQGGISLLR